MASRSPRIASKRGHSSLKLKKAAENTSSVKGQLNTIPKGCFTCSIACFLKIKKIFFFSF